MTSKGLSSVIGAVLLIFISVAAATSAWTFIDSLTEQTQDNVENRVEERNRESQSELTSEIAYNGSDGNIVMTLRNTGAISLALQREDGTKTLDMLVDGEPVNGDLRAWEFMNSESGEVLLEPTQSRAVNTTHSFPGRGEQYTVEFIGPNSVRTTYVCYNSGTSSC